MKKTAIIFSLVLFCLFGFTPGSNFRTVNTGRLVKISPKPQLAIDGATTICNDGRTYTYSITGLDPGDTTTWTWTVSGKVVFSGGENTGTSVDILYDPSTEGSYSHGVIQAFRSTGGGLLKHFNVTTCP
jgi:hypothetical protein